MLDGVNTPMKQSTSLAILIIGLVGIMLVAACSQRKNEQELSPEEQVISLNEQKSAIAEITDIVRNAPEGTITFELNGYKYWLRTYNDVLWVRRSPLEVIKEVFLDEWSFDNDGLKEWHVNIQNASAHISYHKDYGPFHFYYGKDGKRIDVDSFKEEVPKLQEELNVFLEENFGH